MRAYLFALVPAVAFLPGPATAQSRDDAIELDSVVVTATRSPDDALLVPAAIDLVDADEIGRGTSTYDGLALAEACARHLAQANRAYTLFATHYFELTTLAEPGSGIANVHLDAVEHGDALVFMHAVKDGPADRSFGLQVAALAGLPRAVVCQARGRLAELEQQSRDAPRPSMAAAALDQPQQIGLFAPSSAAVEALAGLDPDELTPKQALEALYRLKSLL